MKKKYFIKETLKDIGSWALAIGAVLGLLLVSPFSTQTAYAAQFGQPASDISTGSWTTTPLWSKVDEGVAGSSGDGVTIQSEGVGNNTDTSTIELDLSSINDPGLSTGHIIRVRWNHTSGNSVAGNVALYQGATLKATLTVTPDVTTTENEASYTLSAAEADSITDYTDLRFRIWGRGTAGGPSRSLVVESVEFEVPNAPADLSWSTGAADFEIYQSAVLTWDNGTLVCSATLTDDNASTVDCLSSSVAASTTYRVQVILKNIGGAAATMGGALEFVDHKVVKTGWAGTSPTLGSCGYNDFGTDDTSPTCNLAFSGNDARITTDPGTVTIAASSGSEGFMYLITTDADVPSSDSQSYMDTSIDSVVEDSSKITITGPVSGPTVDQVMRHGNWFNGGLEQSFFWAD